MTDSKTRAELTVDLLTAYRNWIGLAFVAIGVTAVGAVAFLGVNLPSVSISRDQKVFAMAAFGLGILGYFPLVKVYGWIYDPPKRYIVSLGLSGEPGIYELTPRAWQDVTVIEDELYQWDGMTWPTYEAEGFDPNSMTAVGTWRASEPDSELLRYEKRLSEVREDLEEQADTSIDTEIQISSRVRQAVKEIGQAIIDEHASATTYNGERVADVLADIRKDVEEDTGDPTPQRNGEKPTREREYERSEALETLNDLVDSQGGEPADD